MRRVLGILVLSCLGYTGIRAQGSEYGFIVGASGYRGELNPEFYTNLQTVRPAFGFIYRYNFHPHYAWKLGISKGNIEGRDANSTDGFNVNRNLNFRSGILELSGQLEFNFLPYRPENRRQRVTPYIFTGFSVFRFNPQGQLPNGEWMDLHPLGTEGQNLAGGKNYNRIQTSVPMGGGLKICFGVWAVGLELGMRYAFTDYLDDVSGTYTDKELMAQQNGGLAAYFSDPSLLTTSEQVQGRQRGNSQDNDWYMFGGFTVSINLSNPNASCLPFNKKY